MVIGPNCRTSSFRCIQSWVIVGYGKTPQRESVLIQRARSHVLLQLLHLATPVQRMADRPGRRLRRLNGDGRPLEALRGGGDDGLLLLRLLGQGHDVARVLASQELHVLLGHATARLGGGGHVTLHQNLVPRGPTVEELLNNLFKNRTKCITKRNLISGNNLNLKLSRRVLGQYG